MNTDKEISSTEKLLNSIRAKNDSLLSRGSSPPLSIQLDRVPIKKKLAKIIPFRKPITVGVDIGFGSLRFVKILCSDSQYKLLDCRITSFDPQISIASPEFTDFLKSELNDFCGKSKEISLWSAVSIANVDVRYISIPKVSKSKISNAVYWTAKKEIQFNEKETIFDFEEKEEVSENGTRKITAIVYTAPRKEVEELKNLFDKSGFPLAGISMAPFAVQNLFRAKWISPADETVAMLYIGRELSQIDVFFKNSLVLTRGIRAGIHSMIDALVEAEGKPTMDASQAEKVLFSLQNDHPNPFFLAKEDIFGMILPAIERLIRQTERTFEYYSVTLKKKPANRIFICGHMSAYKPLVEHIGKELGITADTFDPLNTVSSLSENIGASFSTSERLVFAMAVGLASSNNSYTPNLLFTYKEKKKVKDIANINKGIILVFLLFLSIGWGFSLWQGHLANIKEAKVTELRQQLDKYRPLLDRNVVFKVAANAKKQLHKNKTLGKKYLGMGIISELLDLTDSNIRLLSMDIDLGNFQKYSDPNNDRRGLLLDGFIYGDREMFESTLAGYLVKLDSSSLFRQPNVTKNSLEFSYKYGEVLRFLLNVQLERGK